MKRIPGGNIMAYASSKLRNSTPILQQTPGMNRAAAITHARLRSRETVGRHRGDPLPGRRPELIITGRWRGVIYVVSGRAAHALGETAWNSLAEAGPGDFIHVPPFVPHQEINASEDEPPVLPYWCGPDRKPVVVNLDIPVAEKAGAGGTGWTISTLRRKA